MPTRLGDAYSAYWTDASTFVLTFTQSDTPDVPPPLHRGLKIRAVGDVRTQLYNAPPSRSAAALAQTSPPQIVSFVARDADNADLEFGEGDELEIVFERAARPPVRICEDAVSTGAGAPDVDPCGDSGG